MNKQTYHTIDSTRTLEIKRKSSQTVQEMVEKFLLSVFKQFLMTTDLLL